MTVRAELLRLGLRLFKGRGSPVDIAAMRRNMRFLERITPKPPKFTKMISLSVGGVPAVRVTTPRSREDWHVLYLHGGAFVCSSPLNYRDFLWRIADAATAAVLCPDYRLAPEHPFPAAVDDAVAAYRWLLAYADPWCIAIIGDSAGGGLTFGTLLRLRDEGAVLPAAAAALSPWTDLALTGASLRLNAEADPILDLAQVEAISKLYLGHADPKHPYASPLYGDFRGLPPALIQVGSDEILRDDSQRLAQQMSEAGCRCEIEVWPRMPHVWQLYSRILPEGREAIERIGGFVRGAFGAR